MHLVTEHSVLKLFFMERYTNSMTWPANSADLYPIENL